MVKVIEVCSELQDWLKDGAILLDTLDGVDVDKLDFSTLNALRNWCIQFKEKIEVVDDKLGEVLAQFDYRKPKFVRERGVEKISFKVQHTEYKEQF